MEKAEQRQISARDRFYRYMTVDDGNSHDGSLVMPTRRNLPPIISDDPEQGVDVTVTTVRSSILHGESEANLRAAASK